MTFAIALTLTLLGSNAFATSPTCGEERNSAVESCEKHIKALKTKDPGTLSGGSSFANTDQYAAMNQAMVGHSTNARKNCEDAREWFDKQCTKALGQKNPPTASIETQRRGGIQELNDLIRRVSGLEAQYAGYAASATAQNDESGSSSRIRSGVQPPHMFQRLNSASVDEE